MRDYGDLGGRAYRLLPVFTDFSDFLPSSYLLSKCIIHQLVYQVYYSLVGLPSVLFLERRNYKIQIGVHVGRKSAVVLSGLTEASYSHFFIGIDLDLCTSIVESPLSTFTK